MRSIPVDSRTLAAERQYLAHTRYHLYPGGRKKLRTLMQVCGERAAALGRAPRVLDVGCGNGPISFPLASRGWELTGIDVSESSVAHCVEHSAFANARFLVHDLARTPLPGAPFDVVVCSEVLEHLPDPDPLTAGLAGAMAEDGRLFVTVPNGYGPREVLGRLERRLRASRCLQPAVRAFRRLSGMPSAEQKWQMHTSNQEQDHVQKFTRRSLAALLNRHGLAAEAWVNAFWFLSLFGKAATGAGAVARFDSRLADILPPFCASGWYVLCRRAERAEGSDPRSPAGNG